MASLIFVVYSVFHLLLVKVYSQTPYLTFMGNIIPNNSYVDLSIQGQVIVCHTNLSSDPRIYSGWFFPNGTALPEDSGNNSNPITQRWLDQNIELQRGPDDSSIPPGIYRCDISADRETFYVGIYETGGVLVHSTMYNISS